MFFVTNRCPLFTIFSEKAVFSDETAKYCFEATFDHFLGKGAPQDVSQEWWKRQFVPFVVRREFSYQNIVATTSSSKTMLSLFLLLNNTKFYEAFCNIGSKISIWKSVWPFFLVTEVVWPKNLHLGLFVFWCFFHKSDRPFRPKMQISSSSSTPSIY